MQPWHIVVGSGLLGAAAVLTPLVLRKKAQYEARGHELEASMHGAAAAPEIAAMQRRIEVYARTVAESSGDRYMRDVYGVTPERIAGIERLARSLGG